MTDQHDGTLALELVEISAAYGRNVVVPGASFSVAPNSIVALLGPNGAGKSTLLRVAAGLMKPRSGQVRLFGEDATRETPTQRARRGLCLIPEGRGIYRSLTVAENVLLHTPPWAHENRLDEAVEAFPILRERLKQVAGRLSGGQQQMLALARVYVSRPRIALLDEVSMGLAPIVIDEIFDFLKRLAAQGIALVLVEQYVNRALDMADHVYMLNQGEITFSGPPSELDEQTVLRGYLGADLNAEA